MKISINLLPVEPEVEVRKLQQKKVIFASEIVLVSFLVLNLVLFGFYWFLNKSTADTLASIKAEETKISSLQPQEKLYRALTAKLFFLASLWQKKVWPEEIINFSQNLVIPEVSLAKITVKQDGMTTLALNAKNSDGLENFLNVVAEKDKTGQIKLVKILSTERNKENGYDFVLSFKFVGVK